MMQRTIAFLLLLPSLIVAVVLNLVILSTSTAIAAPISTVETSWPLAIVGSSKQASQPSANQPSVILVNRFEVSQDQIESFLERWNAIGEYVNQQPGFISAELQKDLVGSSKKWTMSEKWESLEAYKAAIDNPKFQALIDDFPAKATWFAQDLFPGK